MDKAKTSSNLNPEVAAINSVYEALKGLEPEVQARVIEYVARMLKIGASGEFEPSTLSTREEGSPQNPAEGVPAKAEPNEAEGISPVASKWMMRNGFTAVAMSTVFSIGGDEIDLIAKEKTVPGKSKRDRMHSVLLLTGVAAYLASGAARFTYEQLKEACIHYKAYDAPHFATHLKDFAAEVAGDKSTAYTLTARGLANATEILKSMFEPGKPS